MKNEEQTKRKQKQKSQKIKETTLYPYKKKPKSSQYQRKLSRRYKTVCYQGVKR
jgi:hypothetical protein